MDLHEQPTWRRAVQLREDGLVFESGPSGRSATASATILRPLSWTIAGPTPQRRGRSGPLGGLSPVVNGVFVEV